MLKSYTKITVLILLIVILVVEGYFVYLFYQSPQNFPVAGNEVRGVASTDGDDAATKEASSRTSVAAVVHRAAPANTADNSTYIDHPLTNNNPDAVLLATPVWDQDEGSGKTHPIGVWYDSNRGGKWAIFNQDLAPMPEGAVFSVVISEGPAENVFIHRVSSSNTTENNTYIDSPSTNNTPEAILSITPNWNPGGVGGTYNDHPVGIWYDYNEGKWAIFNQDLASMPRGSAFDVAVSGARQDASYP